MSISTLTEKNLKYEVIDYFQTIVNEMISGKPEIIPYFCCQCYLRKDGLDSEIYG